jgi:hypothetical protein
MRFPLIALSLAFLWIALPVTPARAQSHSGYGFASGGRSGAAFSRRGPAARRFAGVYRGRRFYSHSALAPNYYPYYDPYFDSYYDSEDVSVPPPPPPVWQTAAPPAPTSPSKPVESLVMELRGDHWVRLTNYGATAADTDTQSGEPQSAPRSAPQQAKAPLALIQATPPSELPSAVLVFRDGHQEQAAKYTIVGATIYVKADYWTTGSWTRSIPIADLNLAATLQLNQQRGAKFSLPSRPSEVIVR